MRVMRGLEKRGNVWRIRVSIPADLRARWGKREEIVSLNTFDQNEAIRHGAPVLAAIKDRIAAMRAGPAATVTLPSPVVEMISPTAVFDTIQLWRSSTIDQDWRAAFNGILPTVDQAEASRLRYNLRPRAHRDALRPGRAISSSTSQKLKLKRK